MDSCLWANILTCYGQVRGAEAQVGDGLTQAGTDLSLIREPSFLLGMGFPSMETYLEFRREIPQEQPCKNFCSQPLMCPLGAEEEISVAFFLLE